MRNEMRRVEVNGLSVAYEQVGEGPTLVLLHGFTHDSRVWRPQLDGLSERFTVIAWDAPGAALRETDIAGRFGVSRGVARECVRGLEERGLVFVKPGLGLRAFALNTARPLFRNNPQLRRAVNLAVDRYAKAGAVSPCVGPVARTDFEATLEAAAPRPG